MEKFDIVSLNITENCVDTLDTVPGFELGNDTPTMLETIQAYADSNEQNIGIQVEEEPVIEQSIAGKNINVVYTTGMKLVDFLRQNPQVRTKQEVLQYYDEEVLLRAIQIGAIMCIQNRIVL